MANTCAFDSIAHALATAYCDSKKFRELIQKESLLPIHNLAKKMGEKINNKEIYNLRRDILFNIFDHTVSGSTIIRVNCETTITNMVNKLNLNSYIEKTTCGSLQFLF